MSDYRLGQHVYVDGTPVVIETIDDDEDNAVYVFDYEAYNGGWVDESQVEMTNDRH